MTISVVGIRGFYTQKHFIISVVGTQKSSFALFFFYFFLNINDRVHIKLSIFVIVRGGTSVED